MHMMGVPPFCPVLIVKEMQNHLLRDDGSFNAVLHIWCTSLAEMSSMGSGSEVSCPKDDRTV
jgi:hypothetical protein